MYLKRMNIDDCEFIMSLQPTFNAIFMKDLGLPGRKTLTNALSLDFVNKSQEEYLKQAEVYLLRLLPRYPMRRVVYIPTDFVVTVFDLQSQEFHAGGKYDYGNVKKCLKEDCLLNLKSYNTDAYTTLCQQWESETPKWAERFAPHTHGVGSN